MAVLRQLGQEPEPISLPDLIQKLRSGFKERSVRRWLNQLIQEEVVKKMAQRRETKCFVDGRGQEPLVNGVSSCFSSKSLKKLENLYLIDIR